MNARPRGARRDRASGGPDRDLQEAVPGTGRVLPRQARQSRADTHVARPGARGARFGLHGAGAMKADLLADLAAAVDKAVRRGSPSGRCAPCDALPWRCWARGSTRAAGRDGEQCAAASFGGHLSGVACIAFLDRSARSGRGGFRESPAGQRPGDALPAMSESAKSATRVMDFMMPGERNALGVNAVIRPGPEPDRLRDRRPALCRSAAARALPLRRALPDRWPAARPGPAALLPGPWRW